MKAKKVIAIILTGAIIAGAGFGIVKAVSLTTSQNTVTVYQASMLNFGGYMGDNGQTMQGIVTTDTSQNVYVTDTDEIKHVFVKEGQAVHEGDVLLEYDTTKTSLNLQQEKLNNQQIQLNIEVAQKNLSTLRSMKPVSATIEPDEPDDFVPVDPGIVDNGGTDGGNNDTDSGNDGTDSVDNGSDAGTHNGNQSDQKHDEQDETVRYSELTADSKPKNPDTADGTAENPYLYLCEPDENGKITIGTGFIRSSREAAEKAEQKKRYIVLAILNKDDETENAWMQDVLKLDPDKPITVEAATGKADFADLSNMTADQIAKALEGIEDTDKLVQALEQFNGDDDRLSAILKKMDKDTRAKLLQALEEQQKEDEAAVTPTPEVSPAPEVSVTPAAETENPSGTEAGDTGSASGSSAGKAGVTSGAATGETGNASDAAGKSGTSSGTSAAATPTAWMEGVNATSGEAAVYRTITPLSDETLTTAGVSACLLPAASLQESNGAMTVLTADTQTGTGTTSNAADSSADSADGSGSDGTGLISSDTEYTADELKQAIKDQESQLSDLKLDLQESDLKVRKAEQDVTDGVVKAKMNGIIKSVGDPSNPPTDGSAFLQLTGASGLYVKGGVYENRLSSLKEGTEVTVTSWQSGNSYTATVKSISPYPDNSGTFGSDSSNSIYPFIAYIEQSDAALTNGEYVQITMLSGASADGSGDVTDDASSASDSSEGITGSTSSSQDGTEDLTIGSTSATDSYIGGADSGTDDVTIDGGSDFYLYGAFVLDENGKKYVYMRDRDNRLKKQEIKVGKYLNGAYEILSGVTLSDWVAFPYGKNIKEGAPTREGTEEDLYS
ncbi:MAG: biotin/lipoyl-binding protein [Bilifractor sp.]